MAVIPGSAIALPVERQSIPDPSTSQREIALASLAGFLKGRNERQRRLATAQLETSEAALDRQANALTALSGALANVGAFSLPEEGEEPDVTIAGIPLKFRPQVAAAGVRKTLAEAAKAESEARGGLGNLAQNLSTLGIIQKISQENLGGKLKGTIGPTGGLTLSTAPSDISALLGGSSLSGTQVDLAGLAQSLRQFGLGGAGGLGGGTGSGLGGGTGSATPSPLFANVPKFDRNTDPTTRGKMIFWLEALIEESGSESSAEDQLRNLGREDLIPLLRAAARNKQA